MPSKDSTNTRRIGLLCQIAAWSLSVVVCMLAFVAWGQGYGWHFVPINNYQLFPLLGLLAFSLMWSHYIASSLRVALGLEKRVLACYFESTSLAVLFLICLHPGLLIYQRFRDGYGLPPHSYETYVAHGLSWVTLLGTVSWLIFIAYEFRRVFGTRSWWPYVQRVGDLAMLAIFYHALRLGAQLRFGGWFKAVWWFYGITLVVVLLHNYFKEYAARKTSA